MDKLSSMHIAMLAAQARGEGGYRRSATKEAGIKALDQALSARFGDAAADIRLLISDAADYAEARTILAAKMAGSDAIATGGQNIQTGEERTDTEEAAPVKGKKGKAAPAPKPAKPVKPAKEAKAPSDAPRGKRGQFITIKDGHDPYRANTQSGQTWALMKANPGKTFDEYVRMGGRANTISDAIRKDWVSLSETPPAS